MNSVLTAPNHAARTLRQLRWLIRLLDNAMVIPGTRYRVGLDPIIGLVPILGDVLPAAVSVYIVYKAHRMGVSRGTVGKMLANVAIDLLLGIVPIAGDIADFAWKANVRNLVLLERDLGLDTQSV